MNEYDVIVIGAGPAGLSCARFSRKLNPRWRILIIRRQKKSIIPCALPYALDGTIKTDDCIKSDEKLLRSANIDLVIDEVESISCEDNSLAAKSGKSFGYNNLVLATGSFPFVPPIPGANLKNVFSIKDHPDILSILEIVEDVRKAVVVGAGFIGLELVNAFYNRGIEVNLVEMESVCLPQNLSSDFSENIKKDLEARGVKLFLGKVLKEIKGEEKVKECILDDGTKIEADLVVLSVGVRADVSLAQKSGIDVTQKGIKVNEYFQTNIQNIYAVGDCVSGKSFITGKPMNGFLATNAVVEGKFAAMNIAGKKRPFAGIINPAVTKIFDLSCGAAGFTRDAAEKEGLRFLFSDIEVYSRGKSFPGAVSLKMRLIFDRDTLTLIGAEALSKESVSWIINMLSLAILNKNNARELAFMQYCGHPPQIDVPAKMPIVLCAVDVLKQAKEL